MRNLCLLIVVLTLSACAVSKPLSALPTKPLLDSKLAEDCPALVAPDVLDYDVWQTWVQDVVLRAYGDCRARHHETVKAWPK